MKRNSQIVGIDEPHHNIIKNMYNKTITNITFDKKLRIFPLRSGARQGSHFSLSCIGEGNGNPLQCSCLENPRDGGAWWAAIYEVAQSRTRLKRLSSSSSS